MVFDERLYSALVISSSEKLNHSIMPLLSSAHCEPINFANNISTAKRLIAERSFDFVIINAPMPTEPTTKLAADVSSGTGTVCLMLTKADDYANMRAKVTPYGVFTLAIPTSSTAVANSLEFLTSARERLRGFEKKEVSIQDKMEEIRLVNRAKWLLIENRSMTEPDAHRFIEKQAMDTRRARRDVAEEIIHMYS